MDEATDKYNPWSHDPATFQRQDLGDILDLNVTAVLSKSFSMRLLVPSMNSCANFSEKEGQLPLHPHQGDHAEVYYQQMAVV